MNKWGLMFVIVYLTGTGCDTTDGNAAIECLMGKGCNTTDNNTAGIDSISFRFSDDQAAGIETATASNETSEIETVDAPPLSAQDFGYTIFASAASKNFTFKIRPFVLIPGAENLPENYIVDSAVLTVSYFRDTEEVILARIDLQAKTNDVVVPDELNDFKYTLTLSKAGYNTESKEYSVAYLKGKNSSTNFVNDLKLKDIGIQAVSNSNYHTLILLRDGTLWVSGRNDKGQLGLGDNLNRNTFEQVPITDVNAVICSDYSSYALRNDGTLWATGLNGEGQLGTGDNSDRNIFVQVLSDVKMIIRDTKEGYYFHDTYAIKNDGTLWATGLNDEGQLGAGNLNRVNTFVPVLTNVTDLVYCVSDKSVNTAVTNPTGEIGHIIPTIHWYRNVYTVALQSDSSIRTSGYSGFGGRGLGENDYSSASFAEITGDVSAVACGEAHTVALKNDNTLWATGLNDAGQLGTGDVDNRYTLTPVLTDVGEVVCGRQETFAIKNNGSLFATGYNQYGQLGTGDNDNRYVPVQVLADVETLVSGDRFTLALKQDGTLWATGANKFGQLGTGNDSSLNSFQEVLADVDAVSCSSTQTSVLKNNSTVLVVAGDNRYGQLGTGDNENRNSFVQVFP